MENIYSSHTERLSTGGGVSVAPLRDGGTLITVHGHVKNPELIDPRPPAQVAAELRRWGLSVVEC